MKKIYLMLLMICSVCAFTACSDDDDEQQKPQIPVTDVKVPATAEAGTEVTLGGTGYTAASKILLRDAAQKETAAVVKTTTRVDLVFTVPAELTAGDYTVVLSQNGEKWDLGKIAIVARNPITEVGYPGEVSAGEPFEITGKGFADGCEVYLKPEAGEPVKIEGIEKTETGLKVTIPADFTTGGYTLMIRQNGDWSLGILKVVEPAVAGNGPKQIVINNGSKDKIYDLSYNEDGKISSMHVTIAGNTDYTSTVSYEADKVVVTTSGYAGDEAYTFTSTETYTLDGNKVKRNVYEYNDGDEYLNTHFYSYLANGSLEVIDDKVDNESVQNMKYIYTGNDLTSVEWFQGYSNSYVYDYTQKYTNNTEEDIDLSALFSDLMGYPDFLPRLLGIAGNYPENLPGSIKYRSEYDNPGEYPNEYTFALEKSDNKTVLTVTDKVAGNVAYTYTLNY